MRSPTASAGDHGRRRTREPASATHGGQVDVSGDQRRHRRDRRARRLTVLDGGHQTQMPRRHRQLVVARDRPQHRHPGAVAGLTQHLFVARRPDPVEDHPGDVHAAMERRKPLQHSADALALASGVDHQDHRGAEKFGDLRGGPAGRGDRLLVDAAVEQTHHAFDHGDVGVPRAVPVQRPDQLLADQHRVEVAAGPARGQGVIAGVDEVRPTLNGATR